MKRFLLFIIFLLIFSGSSTIAQELSGYTVQVLMAGEFHCNEVSVKSGEEWFGLFSTKDGYELIPSTIIIESVYDPIVDVGDTKTGKRISVDRPTKPLFLVKGLKKLRKGTVETVFAGKAALCPNKSINLRLGGLNDYYIKAFGDGEDIDLCIANNYRTELFYGSRSQVLASFRRIADARPSLIWGGDLDRDGKLDLFMDVSGHYNQNIYKLYLSSMAEDNDLLKEAATFVITGG